MRVVGVDEAGRGTWAGPLTAAAVLVDDDFVLDGLNDSKKLTSKSRVTVLALIKQQAVQVGLGWSSQSEIDALGLSEANRLAMARAVAQINGDYDRLLIDGNIKYLPNCEAIIGGDGVVTAISAASIVAKVMRDSYMSQISGLYPGYGFGKHYGYGTAAHRQAIEALGIADLHRKSFKPIARMSLSI